MVLKGTVRNFIDFGAFVDIGVHQDGLVHISEICDHFIKHPLEAVSVGDIVDVQVLSVDLKKQRIQLTMKIGGKSDNAKKDNASKENSPKAKAGNSQPKNGGKKSQPNRDDRKQNNRKNGKDFKKKDFHKGNNFFDGIVIK